MQGEKRKDMRIHPVQSMPFMVRFRIAKGGLPIEIARGRKSKVENISVGGMCLELPGLGRKQLDDLVAGKERLVLEFISPSLKKPIKVIGKPVWLRKKDKAGRAVYVLGVSFAEVTPQQREAILGQLLIACLSYGCIPD